MMRITLSRAESFDPIEVIEQASAQAAAERMVREPMYHERGRALTYYYDKDSNQTGDYIDLVIEGRNHGTVAIIQKRLQARGYEIDIEYLQDEEPADLVEITDTEDGCPADDDRAREVMDYFGYSGPLERGPRPGLYRVSLPKSVLKEDTATLDDGDYHVEVIEASTEPYSREA